jgi:hypothetical protein
MATAKAEVNKSEAIRQALNELPNAKAKDIVAHLKAKGIETTDQLVYKIKTASKKKKPGRKPGMVSQAKAPSSSPKVHLGVGASIGLAKMTAEKIGGWSTLKEIVDALA